MVEQSAQMRQSARRGPGVEFGLEERADPKTKAWWEKYLKGVMFPPNQMAPLFP